LGGIAIGLLTSLLLNPEFWQISRVYDDAGAV
jgi:hypothetical protein